MCAHTQTHTHNLQPSGKAFGLSQRRARTCPSLPPLCLPLYRQCMNSSHMLLAATSHFATYFMLHTFVPSAPFSYCLLYVAQLLCTQNSQCCHTPAPVSR